MKTSSAMSARVYMMVICDKFYWNPSTEYSDNTSQEAGVNRQWLDGRMAEQLVHIMLSAYYCWRGIKTDMCTALSTISTLQLLIKHF